MNTQITTPNTKTLVVPRRPETLSEDIQIGSLALVQGSNHPLLKSGQAKPGDIFNSVTNQVVGSAKLPVEILPLVSQEVWDWYYIDGPKKEFSHWQKRTNQNPEWRDKDFTMKVKDNSGKERIAKPFKGVKAVVMTVKDLDLLPVKVSFRKSSYFSGGQGIQTARLLAERQGHSFFQKTLMLGVQEKSYQGNDWLVLTISPGRLATKEEMTKCELWTEMFSSKPVDLGDDGSANEDA